jgi:hypothetical protein
MEAVKSKLNEHGYHVTEEFFETLEEADKAGLSYPRTESIFLDSDIRRGNIVSPYFPANLTSMQDGIIEGSCVLQLHSTVNSGISKRKQIGLVNLTQYPRILAMTFTDGHTKAIGIEVVHLNNLSSKHMAPGTKYLYKGGKVLMGKILLTPDNIKPLGGVVQHMYESWIANINVQKMRLKNVKISTKDGGPPQFELNLSEGGMAHMKKKSEKVHISISDTLFGENGVREKEGDKAKASGPKSSKSEGHTNTGRNDKKGSKNKIDDCGGDNRGTNYHDGGDRGGRGRGGKDMHGRGSVRGRGSSDGRGRGGSGGRGRGRDNDRRGREGSHSTRGRGNDGRGSRGRGSSDRGGRGKGRSNSRGGYGGGSSYDTSEPANTGFDFDDGDFPSFGSVSIALPPQPPNHSGKSWKCKSCTFANHPDIHVCEMCNTKR